MTATSDDSWTNLSAPGQIGASTDDEKVVRRFQIPLVMPQYDKPRSHNRSQRSVHFSDATDSWKQLSNGVLRDYTDDDDDYVRSEISDETHSSDTTHGVEEIEDTMEMAHSASLHAGRSESMDEGLSAAELLKSYSELPVEMEYDVSQTDTMTEDQKLKKEKVEEEAQKEEETEEKEEAAVQQSSKPTEEEPQREKEVEDNEEKEKDVKELEEDEVKTEEAKKQTSKKKDPPFIERLQDMMKSSYTRLGAPFEPCPWLSYDRKIWPEDTVSDVIFATPEDDASSSYRLENIHVKRRQTHAFVAPPGCGKSQAASSLCRLYGKWEISHIDDHFALLILLKPSMLVKSQNSIENFVWETFLSTDEGATYQDLAQWLENCSKRVLFALDVDTNEQDICRNNGTLRSLLRRDLFPDSTIFIFADGIFLTDWAMSADFEVASIFHLNGWRNNDVERQVLNFMDRVAAEGAKSPASRALKDLRSSLTNETIENCCQQNASLLTLLLASDDQADHLDLTALVKGLSARRGDIYSLLVERAAISVEVDSNDEKESSGQRAKAMKKLMSNRWSFVENGLSPECYAEGFSFQCGEFSTRSRDFDEFCAARHLYSQYFKARRDGVMGGSVRHSEWWANLELCWDMGDESQGGTRFGYLLPFLAGLMRNEPEAVLAPLKDLFSKFSPEAKQRCNLVCRQCLLEVGNNADAWEKSLKDLLGSRKANELLSDPSYDPPFAPEEDAEHGDHENDKGHRAKKKRKAEDVERLIGRVGDSLVLNFNELIRSVMKDETESKTVDLLEPLASLVEELGQCSSLRNLTVDFNADTLPSDAFPILVSLFELEFPELRRLELILATSRVPRWSTDSGRFGPDQLGAVMNSCSGFLARCEALKKLSLTGAFLSSDVIIGPLRQSIINHPALRSLTIEGHEGGSSVHRRAVSTMESVIRDHGWREIHFDSSNFNRLTTADTLRQSKFSDFNGDQNDRSFGEELSQHLSAFNGFSLGGVGAAGWVSCLRRSRCPLSSTGTARSWSSQDLNNDCAEESPETNLEPQLDNSEDEALKILRGADGHQRLHHVHLYAGHVSNVVHGILLDTLIGCRHLKTFSLSCQRLDDSLLSAISSGVTCAVHLQNIGVEGRWSAPFTGGAIFGLVQAACAAGSVQSVRIKGNAMNVSEFRDLPFALSTILTAPPKEELEVRLEGEVMALGGRQQEIIDALENCETPENITFNSNLTVA